MATIKFHPHALERMQERGASRKEVKATIEEGVQYAANFNRVGFQRNFTFEGNWQNKFYRFKQVDVIAVNETTQWMVITVIVKYY